MKISPVTRILLAGAIIVGSMGLSGCKIKCGEAEPAQLSQEGRTNASTSLLTLMAAIGDERLSTLCGLDIGCTSRTYLSDSFADLYEDPKIYLDYEQGANQAVSFYGMETAAEGGSVIIFGALNNVDNRSLRMDAGDISALTEILVDIVYSDTKPAS